MKLCLGTVQFGMDYGIKGQKKPSLNDSIKMLDYATQNGINHIDTARAYGDAENIVGEFIKKKTISRNNLFISSKLKPNVLDDIPESKYYDKIKSELENQLKILNTDYLDAYMCHSSRYIYNDKIIETMNKLKKEGLIKHSGVSVYEVEEAKECINSSNVDFMQLPFSIFDQRMLKGGVFNMEQKYKTEIHSRSAFIQGLILMNENEVPKFLEKAKPIIKKIDKLCKDYNISRIALAIGFVKLQNKISHLVFGVDNIEQLKEDIMFFQEDLSSDIINKISIEFENLDTSIVMPSLWKK